MEEEGTQSASGMLMLVSREPARVLIVDDQQPFRAAAREVVALTEGFEVAGEAATGERSVEMIAELDPDLVLMDYKLLGIDGLDATRQILRLRPRCIVVVLSTYDSSELRNAALDAGAAAFVPKDEFGAEELERVWLRALAGAEGLRFH